MLSDIINNRIKPTERRKNTAYPSMDDLVYLTDVYGAKYAIERSIADKDPFAAIIAIDTTKLDHSKFLPDDRFIFDTMALSVGPNIDEEVVRFSIKRGLKDRGEYAAQSLRRQGIIAYSDAIMADAIISVAVYKFSENLYVTDLFRSMPVALGDHDTNRHRYAQHNRWLFEGGETMTAPEFNGVNPTVRAQISDNQKLVELVRIHEETVGREITNRPITYIKPR